MKNKTIYRLIFTTIFLISLTGCGTFNKNLGILQLQTQRPVENNVFSSSFPEIKLQVNRELRYLGSALIGEDTDEHMTANTDPREKSFEATAYLFGKMDSGNRIVKGVLIRILVMHGDPSQILPKTFAKTSQNILESGEMKILEEQYQYDLHTDQELFSQKEKELLANRRVPSCLLVKQLSVKSGFGNKSRVHLLYFEDVSNTCGNQPCGTCLDPRNRTAEQKQFLQEFTDRSYASVRFLETKTIEDKTSRYVDAEPKMQPAPAVIPVAPVAPVEKAPPVAESIKADTLEKRLETLKRVYEKNLISKEDYEKKKAEILNEL